MGLFDSIRSGAADVLGFREDLERADALEERFVEASADAKLLMRKLEDVGWTQQGVDKSTYFDVTQASRREEVKKAYLYYFRDPIVGRTVSLFTNYVFGKGVPKPKYRTDPDAADPEGEAEGGQAVIDEFWTDAYNQKALFGEEAQRMKSTEIQLQSNVFLLMLDGDDEETLGGAGGTSVARITDLPEPEITDIITHPGDRKIPVYYERKFTPRVKNFKTGMYDAQDEQTVYYRDWKFEPPTEWDGKPWGPDAKSIKPGRVFHLAKNRTSDMKFGIPEAARFLKWAEGLNQYMTARMALVQTISQLAMQAKVRGGPRHVSQIQGQIAEMAKIADGIEGLNSGTGSLRRDPAAHGSTKVPVSNQGVALEPMVQDTNSAGAQGDIRTFKGQIAAGSGVPVHHLGDEGSANLATATSMDAPLQRLCESEQEMWEGTYREILGDQLERRGFDPSRLEVQMPPILQRDVNTVMAVVTGTIGAVDPNVTNRDLVRWAVGEILDAMGKLNTTELLDQFFPENWVSPMEQTLLVGQMQMAMGAGSEEQPQDTGGSAPAAAGRQKVTDAATDSTAAANRGRRTAGRDDPGGAIAASGDRARDRRERSMSAPAEARIIEAGLGESGADPTPTEMFDLPPELAAIAAEALAVAEGDVDH